MKLILEESGGMRVAVSEIESLNCDTRAIILCLAIRLKPEDAEQLKRNVETELGKKCFVFGPEVAKVLGVK